MLQTKGGEGGLLVYVRSYLPLRQLTKYKISSDIQDLSFEINLGKEKWFFLSIYKPPLQNCQYFLDSWHNIIDFYSAIYDNHTEVISIWILLTRSCQHLSSWTSSERLMFVQFTSSVYGVMGNMKIMKKISLRCLMHTS